MANNNTFSFNVSPQTVEYSVSTPGVNVQAQAQSASSADNYIMALQANELYQVAPGTIELNPSYDISNLIADTQISHVDAVKTLLDRHLDLFNSIRDKIAADDEQTALHKRLQKFIGKWRDDPDVAQLLGEYFTLDEAKKGSITIIRDSSRINIAAIKSEDDNDSSALFKLSRFAMNDFHRMSSLRRDVTRLKRTKSLQLTNSLRKRSLLEKEIEEARADFENSEKSRLKTDENYAIVRGLLEQQLQAVDDVFAERYRILSNPQGICYVRVNDLPMEIEYHKSDLIAEPAVGSLPQSCAAKHVLPARLEPFIELLCDQPMSSWRRLKSYWRLLPMNWQVQPPARSNLNFQQNISLLPTVFHVLLKGITTLQKQAIAPKVQMSLSDGSRRLADEITLEQLTNTRNGNLRQMARRLEEELEQATACLLDQLLELPANLRYQWSRLAEDDALNTQNIYSWPGFHDFAGETLGLQLREIHEWLYLQLDDDAVAEARTAMRTLIRACMLQVVNDDPEELLTGKVVEFPGIIKPGVLLTANLNRIPQLSSMLKVYDSKQQLVAEAKVVDSKTSQASLEIISAYTAIPEDGFANWTVVGHKVLFNAGYN